MKGKDGLTDKQAAFVREYLVDLNATQAAIRSGYAPRSAEVTGSRLLSNDKVASAIQAGMDKRAAKTGITAEKVLADIERLREKSEEAENYPAAIKAVELLGKHLKLFTEKHEVAHTGTVRINVAFGDD